MEIRKKIGMLIQGDSQIALLPKSYCKVFFQVTEMTSLEEH